jgi:hypothetical protein
MPSKAIKLAVPIATALALALPAISSAQPTTTNQASANTTSPHADFGPTGPLHPIHFYTNGLIGG